MIRPGLPKAELHCHVEGTIHPHHARELARRQGASIDDIAGEASYRWRDFSGFLAAYDRVAALLTKPQDYTLLVRRHLRALADQGALYSELFISPDHARAAGLSFADYLAGLSAGVDDAPIPCRFIVVAVRHFGPDAAEKAARCAAEANSPLVTGFGLAGDERVHRPADFARAFDIARAAGLGLTAHAGEFAGPDAIVETLDSLKVSRIGHGVRAVEDDDLMRRLAAEGITLEVCPASNIALGLYKDIASHPIARLHAAGIRLTLNSDDPPFFDTGIAHEYALAEGLGFREATLVALTRNALEAAFVTAGERQKLLSQMMSSALRLGAPGAVD